MSVTRPTLIVFCDVACAVPLLTAAATAAVTTATSTTAAAIMKRVLLT
jgi:hypothetical protein